MLQLCMTQQKSKILCAMPKNLHSQKKKKKTEKEKDIKKKKRKNKTQTTLMNIVKICQICISKSNLTIYKNHV